MNDNDWQLGNCPLVSLLLSIEVSTHEARDVLIALKRSFVELWSMTYLKQFVYITQDYGQVPGWTSDLWTIIVSGLTAAIKLNPR